jgi:DNA end-binding protein Ku
MEPQRGGDKAYVLLRDALEASKKIAIAKVVIKTRQHLAAVKPQGDGLMLELMHFANELIDVEEFKLPTAKDAGKKELQMAQALIDSMSGKWEPEEFVDEYRAALEKVIEDKLENGDQTPVKAAKKPKATNVIDLVAVLQKSLAESSKGGGKVSKAGTEKKTAHKAPKPSKAAKPRRKAA